MPIETRILRRGDEALLTNVAPDLFDDALDADATREFLQDPRHHLAVAMEDTQVVGFASAVHYVHPDKPRPELWINEVAVAANRRGRGIGKALLRALLACGRDLGCTEAWVLTERTNAPAMRLYASLDGVEAPADQVMFRFSMEAA